MPVPRKLYLSVGGTWGQKRRNKGEIQWFQRNSPFYKRVRELSDFDRVEQDRDPDTPDKGYWGGELKGLIAQDFVDRVRGWFGMEPRYGKWKDDIAELSQLIVERWQEWQDAGDQITIVAHSHGGAVVARVLEKLHNDALKGIQSGDPNTVPIRFSNIRLVTVDMPVRRKLYPVYKAAASQVSTWTHLYSNWYNWTRLGGARLIGPCRCPFATRNMQIRGGHGGALNETKHMHQVIQVL